MEIYDNIRIGWSRKIKPSFHGICTDVRRARCGEGKICRDLKQPASRIRGYMKCVKIKLTMTITREEL